MRNVCIYVQVCVYIRTHVHVHTPLLAGVEVHGKKSEPHAGRVPRLQDALVQDM